MSEKTRLVSITERNWADQGGLAASLFNPTFVDGQLKRIEYLGAVIESDYGLKLLVPGPTPKTKKWAVNGTVLGLRVAERFDHDFEAQNRKRELEEAGRYNDDTKLSVEEIEVEID